MNNKDLFESEEFRNACEKTCEKIADEYPLQGNRQHVFSDEFELKMEQLTKRKPKRHYFKLFNSIGRRIAVITIVAVIILTTTVFSVKALRVPVIDFFVKVYEDFFAIFADDADKEYSEDFEFTPKSPTYIPEGFSRGNIYLDFASYREDYLSGAEVIYYIKQDRLYQNQKVDTEQYDEMIERNGIKYYYYITDNKNRIVWFDAEYSYMIFGNITKEEMIKIAQSMEFVYLD